MPARKPLKIRLTISGRNLFLQITSQWSVGGTIVQPPNYANYPLGKWNRNSFFSYTTPYTRWSVGRSVTGESFNTIVDSRLASLFLQKLASSQWLGQ